MALVLDLGDFGTLEDLVPGSIERLDAHRRETVLLPDAMEGQAAIPGSRLRGEIRCQFIILARKDELGEIRCQFIILARKDELRPDFPRLPEKTN